MSNAREDDKDTSAADENGAEDEEAQTSRRDRIASGPENRFAALLAPAKSDDTNEWLLSYADVTTLIIVFLVLMFAFADFERNEASTDQDAPETAAASPQPPIAPATPLSPIRQQLLDQLAPFRAIEQYRLDTSDEAVTVTLADQLLFAAGEAELSWEGLDRLDELLPVLRSGDYPITVEGHTDSTPIQTERFPSNWELSASRATQVVRYLIDQGIAAERLKAVGYADTRPLSDEDSPSARAANRRVRLKLEVPE